MRSGIALAFLLASASAAAQTESEPQRALTDFNAQNGALESATTQDCATACKALESLARAAQHLCDVAPEHCDEAKAKLKTATDRVRAACPQCEVRAQTAEPPPQTHFAGQEVSVQSAPTHGGCAGCAIGPTSNDAGAIALAIAALGAGIRRRRRRRDDLRRVRDALRVESEPD